jgi:hypothetical protein
MHRCGIAWCVRAFFGTAGLVLFLVAKPEFPSGATSCLMYNFLASFTSIGYHGPVLTAATTASRSVGRDVVLIVALIIAFGCDMVWIGCGGLVLVQWPLGSSPWLWVFFAWTLSLAVAVFGSTWRLPTQSETP